MYCSYVNEFSGQWIKPVNQSALQQEKLIRDFF